MRHWCASCGTPKVKVEVWQNSNYRLAGVPLEQGPGLPTNRYYTENW